MSRCVNFWCDGNRIGIGNILQSPDILPGIRAVFSRQARKTRAVETEGSITMHPIGAVPTAESIVVEMNVKIIHFIPRHELHKVFQVAYGEKLAPGVKHETP